MGQKNFLSRPQGAPYDKKNSFFSPDNSEIQNLPLIHLPIYKQIFFSGSSDQKKISSVLRAKPAPGAKKFFCLMTPKKKFSYILVNGLMANFEFRSCRTKKMNFFRRGAPPGGGPKNFFDPKFFKYSQKLKFRRILELER